MPDKKDNTHLNELAIDIFNCIQKAGARNKISIASSIGVLELVKADLIANLLTTVKDNRRSY